MIPFKYSRKKRVYKKDVDGNHIPLLRTVAKEDGTTEQVVVPNQFETEEVWATDYINLSLFIRTHELDNGNIIVLLDDGHEVTEVVPTLKNPKKPYSPSNVTETKQRNWVQSEILLEKPEEIERLYNLLDQYGPEINIP